MLSFTAVAIAVIGFVPMVWAYAQAIDYGFNVNILNHWGIYLVIIGFIMYVLVRTKITINKRNYQKNKQL